MTTTDIAAAITAANKPLIRFAPTTVVLRRWRRHVAAERALRARIKQARTCPTDDAYWQLVDEYDRAADAASAAYFVLVERGLEPCFYCVTVPPAPHHADTCPDLLTVRLYGGAS